MPDIAPEGLSTTDSMALALAERLERGKALSPKMKTRLLAAIANQKPTSAAPATPPAQQTVVSSAQQAVAKAVDDKLTPVSETWKLYQSPPSLKESAKLPNSEKQYVDEVVKVCAKDVVAFRVLAKPMGADLWKYEEDFRAFDIQSGSVSFDNMSTLTRQRLSREALQIVNSEPESNYLVLLDDPTDPSRMILTCRLFGSGNQGLPLDDRRCRVTCNIVLKKGPATDMLQKQRSVSLAHFIIKNLAMQIRPESWAFFDYSLSGDRNIYGEAKNPQTLINIPSRKIVRAEDTSKYPPDTRKAKCESDMELLVMSRDMVAERLTPNRGELNLNLDAGSTAPQNFAKYKRIKPQS